MVPQEALKSVPHELTRDYPGATITIIPHR